MREDGGRHLLGGAEGLRGDEAVVRAVQVSGRIRLPGHRAGKLKLDELITKTYTLDEINIGYDDMRNGRNIRGIIDFAK